jgi:glutathione S-transferase
MTQRRVLYRCGTPTNFLCPCGAAARRLKKHGVEYETRRVKRRRSDRPEILELTRQDRVPVLVDGDEVIHDSKRILEYVEWRYTMDSDDRGKNTGSGQADRKGGGEGEGAPG